MGTCELCGKNGNIIKSNVEGVVMGVCQNCSKFGNIVTAPRPRIAPQMQRQRIIRRFVKKEEESNEILVEDYGKIIKRKRESQNLKQEHLAKKMSIKESIIHNIERQHMRPPFDLARKFERILNIKLIEKDE